MDPMRADFWDRITQPPTFKAKSPRSLSHEELVGSLHRLIRAWTEKAQADLDEIISHYEPDSDQPVSPEDIKKWEVATELAGCAARLEELFPFIYLTPPTLCISPWPPPRAATRSTESPSIPRRL